MCLGLDLFFRREPVKFGQTSQREVLRQTALVGRKQLFQIVASFGQPPTPLLRSPAQVRKALRNPGEVLVTLATLEGGFDRSQEDADVDEAHTGIGDVYGGVPVLIVDALLQGVA